MKKLFIIAAALITLSLQSFAKEVKSVDDDSINMYVKENASKIFWKTVNNYQVANFKKDGYVMKAFYDEQGNLVSTTKQLKSRNELPTPIVEALDKKFIGWGMTDLIEEKGLDKETVYYANITDGDKSKIIKLTANGKIKNF